jgi:hypothetical protein
MLWYGSAMRAAGAVKPKPAEIGADQGEPFEHPLFGAAPAEFEHRVGEIDDDSEQPCAAAAGRRCGRLHTQLHHRPEADA